MNSEREVVELTKARFAKLTGCELAALYKKHIRNVSPRHAAKPRIVMEWALLYFYVLEWKQSRNLVSVTVNQNAAEAYKAETIDDLIASGLLFARRSGMEEIISECPSFKKGYSTEAPECIACQLEFKDEFDTCKQSCTGKAPTTSSALPISTSADGLFEFKPFRPGTQAALLIDLLTERRVLSVLAAADHIAQILKAPKDKVVTNVKGYVSEWARGKVNMKPTNLPFSIVIQKDIITYTPKEKV